MISPRVICRLSLFACLLTSACTTTPEASPADPAPPTGLGSDTANSGAVTSEAGAIAVVLADIERRGRDPKRSECSARESDDSWHVTAWRIVYPENTGSSRFVPGGFTTYTVSRGGEILVRRPGH